MAKDLFFEVKAARRELGESQVRESPRHTYDPMGVLRPGYEVPRYV